MCHEMLFASEGDKNIALDWPGEQAQPVANDPAWPLFRAYANGVFPRRDDRLLQRLI